MHVYGCINSDYTERSKEEITLCPFLSSSPSYLNKKKKLTSYVTSDKSSNPSKYNFLICYGIVVKHGLPRWLRQKRICLQCRRPGLDPWAGKIPWRREWLPTPVFLPGEPHGQRCLPGPWGHKESDKNLVHSIIIFS